MIIYKNIDYLTFGIESLFVYEYLNTIVDNNDTRIFLEKYTLVLQMAYDNVKIFNLYSNEVERVGVRVGFIRLSKTEARGCQIKLDLGGAFFSHHDINDIYDLFFFFQVKSFRLYRLDFCADVVGRSPIHFYRKKELTENYNRDIRTNYKMTKKGKKYLNWFSLFFTEQDFRIYDKMLDISETGGNQKILWDKHYKTYAKEKGYITRFEISFKRRGLKKFDFSNVDDIYDFGHKKLYNFMNKYFGDIGFPKKELIYKRNEVFDIGESNIDMYIATMKAYKRKLIYLYHFTEMGKGYKHVEKGQRTKIYRELTSMAWEIESAFLRTSEERKNFLLST